MFGRNSLETSQACTHASMHVRTDVLCTHVHMIPTWACTYVRMCAYVRTYVCAYVRMHHVHTNACLYTCMHALRHVCMDGWMAGWMDGWTDVAIFSKP